jgi:hypothetical protein
MPCGGSRDPCQRTRLLGELVGVMASAGDSLGFPNGAICTREPSLEACMIDSPCSGFWTVEQVRLRVTASPPRASSIGVEVPSGGKSLT